MWGAISNRLSMFSSKSAQNWQEVGLVEQLPLLPNGSAGPAGCAKMHFFQKLHSCRVRAWCALIQYIYAKLHTTSMMFCFAIKQNEKIELQNKRLFSKQVSIIISFCLQAICHNFEAVSICFQPFMPPARLVYTKPCVLETWYVLYHEHCVEGILKSPFNSQVPNPIFKGKLRVDQKWAME